jgi:hypothetical protein
MFCFAATRAFVEFLRSFEGACREDMNCIVDGWVAYEDCITDFITEGLGRYKYNVAVWGMIHRLNSSPE